eukprot:sb/3468116/
MMVAVAPTPSNPDPPASTTVNSTTITLPALSDPFEDAPAALMEEFLGSVDKDTESADTLGEMKKQPKRNKTKRGGPPPLEKCRICLCGHEEGDPLIQPCECLGTMQYVHRDCLIHWLNTSFKGRCEVCFYQFKIKREKNKIKNWKIPPMSSTQKAKYGIIFSLHVVTLIFFIWADYALISQCLNSDKDSTSYWIKVAIITVASLAFVCFVIHQSSIYVRLYERVSVFNMAIVNVFGKEENVSRFSKRDDLTMTSGMFDGTSGGSIGGFFDMQ